MRGVDPTSTAHRHLITRLRRAYEALPRELRYRYRTLATNEFVVALSEAVEVFGVADVAQILGVTVHGVRAMAKVRPVPPSRALPWPASAQLQELGHAWVKVRARNDRHQVVHKHHPEHRSMQAALEPLLNSYSLTVIASASGIPLARLRRFAPEGGTP